MVLDIRVTYKAPSKERLFLGDGWGGVRDVRVPWGRKILAIPVRSAATTAGSLSVTPVGLPPKSEDLLV